MTIVYSKQSNKLKETIFTLNFGNIDPEITKITYPFIEKYAKKIGAQFVIINKRKFPNFPESYEKLQIYELGNDNDWNVFIDSECLVHPDLFDFAEVVSEDAVLNYSCDFAGNRFKYDNYFRRDGRNIGSINFLTVVPHLCHDAWKPLDDISVTEALTNTESPNFIDDYVISRNIAKFGLKFKTFADLLNEIQRSGDQYFYYDIRVPKKDIVGKLREQLSHWKY